MTAHQHARPMPVAPRRQKPRACLKSLRLQRIRKRKVAMEILGFECPRVIADEARIGESLEQRNSNVDPVTPLLSGPELGFLEVGSDAGKALFQNDFSSNRRIPPSNESAEMLEEMDTSLSIGLAKDLPDAPGATRKTAEQVSDLGQLPGIGPSLIWMLNQAGIETLADLAQAEPELLTQNFGVVGQILDLGIWIDFAKAHHRP